MAVLLIRSFMVSSFSAERLLTQVITANRLVMLLKPWREGFVPSCRYRFVRPTCQTFATCRQRQSSAFEAVQGTSRNCKPIHLKRILTGFAPFAISLLCRKCRHAQT